MTRTPILVSTLTLITKLVSQYLRLHNCYNATTINTNLLFLKLTTYFILYTPKLRKRHIAVITLQEYT